MKGPCKHENSSRGRAKTLVVVSSCSGDSSHGKDLIEENRPPWTLSTGQKESAPENGITRLYETGSRSSDVETDEEDLQEQ